MTFETYASFDLTRGISAFRTYTYRCSASIEKGVPSYSLVVLGTGCWTLHSPLLFQVASLSILNQIFAPQFWWVNSIQCRGSPCEFALSPRHRILNISILIFLHPVMPVSNQWKSVSCHRLEIGLADPTSPEVPSWRRKKKDVYGDSPELTLHFLLESSDTCPPLKSAIGIIHQILIVVEVRWYQLAHALH